MRPKHLALAIPRNVAMAALWPREKALLARAPDAPPPVFVIGPPRSGTTLVYEALVATFRLAYFSNLAHRLYRTPVAATSLGMRMIESYEPTYESDWGHVAGWAAPCEAGWIWDRWFPAHDDAMAPPPRGQAESSMRATIAGLCRVMRGPFVNKNVNHSVWVSHLARTFPNAVFVEIRRDPAACARSMLKARRAEGGERQMHEWVAVKPSGWARFSGESPEVQCVAQAMLVERQIEQDAAGLDPERRLVVPYESFCADPGAWLEKVRWRMLKSGAPVRERREPPPPFERRGDRKRDDLSIRLDEAGARVREAIARPSPPATIGA